MDGWNFAPIWETVAAEQPDAVAAIHGRTSWTWALFDRRADGIARTLLDRGADRGTKVAFYLQNSPAYLELFFACSKASLVHVNTNYRYGDEELVYLWDNADAAVVVFDATFEAVVDRIRDRCPRVHTWVEVGADETASWAIDYETAASAPLTERPTRSSDGLSGDDIVMLYTGGTTGMPKGVMWRQDDLVVVTDSKNRESLPEDPDVDRVGRSSAVAARLPGATGVVGLPACPLMHGAGLFNALNTLALGGTIVTLDMSGLDVEALFDAVQTHSVKSLFIVGDAFARPMLEALDAEPERWDLGSLRVMISSGVMWSTEVKEGLMRHVPRLLCVDTYGSSEAVGIGSSVSSRDGSARTATFSLSDRAVVIADDGRLVTPGSEEIGRVGLAGRVPVGYYKDEAKTLATFPTVDGIRYSVPGDFATVAEDGTITLLGRGSVCINTGGEKVFPEEVEEAIKTHPDVKDAIVVGVADPRFGQRVAAVVAPESVDVAAVTEHVKQRLAGYKAPRQVLTVASLERAANGKIDYRRWTEFAERALNG